MEEIRKLDRKTRKLLTMERMHHPRADVDRMYLPRNKGGRGLIQLEIAYKTATIGLDAYLNVTKNDPLLVIAKEHEKAKKKYSVANQARVFRRELNLLKYWNLRTKFQLSMPEMSNKKQNIRPKFN